MLVSDVSIEVGYLVDGRRGQDALADHLPKVDDESGSQPFIEFEFHQSVRIGKAPERAISRAPEQEHVHRRMFAVRFAQGTRLGNRREDDGGKVALSV